MLDQLYSLKMTKRALAKELGYTPEQVTRWADNPPVFVDRYLDLKLSLKSDKRCQELEAKYNDLLKVYNNLKETIRQALNDGIYIE